MDWNPNALAPPPQGISLAEYVNGIDALCSTRPILDGIRAFNHQMVDVLDQQAELLGQRVLDVGAAYGGFALERALALGAREYVGVSLEVGEPHDVRQGEARGQLLRMNAEQLQFEDQSFDRILSLSCFEHFHDGERVLKEMHRLLRPGGAVFVSFEPIWTCSYGHHLHHLPKVAAVLPPWAHLDRSETELRAELVSRWPTDAEKTLEEALDWIFRQPFINRVPIEHLRSQFERSPFRIEWLVPLEDPQRAALEGRARELATRLPWSVQDLLTIGFSMLLRR